MAPSQVVVDKEPGGASALDPSVVQSPDRRKRRIRTVALQNNRECGERFLEIRGPEQALIPRERRIEIIHEVLRKDVRVSSCKRVQRLGRKSVEQRVDRIGVGGLEPGIRLKAKPRGVFLIDVVIDASRLYLFVVIARMRDALAIRATVPINRNCGRTPANIERTAEHREGRSVRIAIECKHLLIERHRLRRRLINRSRDGIGSTQWELLQNVILECRSWNGRGCHNRKRNPNPLAVEKKEQLLANDRASNASPE